MPGKIGNVGGTFSGSVKGPASVKGVKRKSGSDEPTLETEEFSEKQRDKSRDNSDGTTYIKQGGIDTGSNHGSLDAEA